MILPTATYRLQFRNGMTFDRATGLVGHWRQLGISHVYASPTFAAASGSTHGYDVVDPTLVDPAIGGREGFDRFAASLKQAGIGLILDIVPNHLAASLENPWWRSVVEWGAESPFARYFDVDWTQKLTLPVLAGRLDAELSAGNLKLVIDAQHAALAVDYLGSRYPLCPATYRTDLSSLDRQMSSDTVTLRDSHVLDLQPWRFIPWWEAADGLSYRRFFEITGLVGVRVERPEVFEAVHRTVLGMVARGQVDGLRIDHVDGLADPEAYLERLRDAIGPDVHLVVEKILEGDEQLPRQWPVNGTTGYEFIAALADVLTVADTPALDDAYNRTAPENADGEAAFRRARELMVDRNFRGEVRALQHLAGEIAEVEGAGLATPEIEAAVRDVLIAFPVYRTYGSPRGLHPSDERVLDGVFAKLLAAAPPHGQAALRFVEQVLRGRVGADAASQAERLRTRMQHLTGPLLAKALEDTFFYRYNRMLALNEVGGDPLARDGSVERFHARMQQRLGSQPTGLTATSTHDTKRGEDARARLYAISEAPDLWVAAFERWSALHADVVTQLEDGPAPEPNVEWMLYQALAGVWPPGLDIGSEAALEELRKRFLPYVEKAVREAKSRTNWGNGRPDYEAAVARYAGRLLSGGNQAFLRDLGTTLQPFIEAGFRNSLTQTLLKLTAPGIPDIYQGCEGLDFSLVDPDNRRLPDFEHMADHPVAREKSELIARMLRLRRQKPDLLTNGEYLPLQVRGGMRQHLIAFARRGGGDVAIVLALRLGFGLIADGRFAAPQLWSDTQVVLPGELRGRTFENIVGNRLVDEAEGVIFIDAAFAEQPYAVLASPLTG